MERVRLHVMALDCPDPLTLAGFYAALTGLQVEPLGEFPPEKVTWIELLNDGCPTLGFQKVDDFRPPTWPTGPLPQQAHLDFYVDDLDDGERFALSLGARKAKFQPGGASFRVYLDPAGHPFCLVVPATD